MRQNKREHQADDLNGDAKLLMALASMYYIYRMFSEAHNIIGLIEHLGATNRAVLEFKIVLLAELGQYHDVLREINTLQRYPGGIPVELIAIRNRASLALKNG